MRISVTMRTCDRTLNRPGPNYLHQTLDNAHRAGIFDSPHLWSFDVVLSHPETPAVRSELFIHGTRVEVHHPTCPLTPNVAATAAHTAAESHNADYVLFLEDDLDFCDDFLGSVSRWLTDYAEHQYPIYVFGHVRSKKQSNSQLYPVREFYGTQCYAVPRHRHGQLTQWLQDNPTFVPPKGKPTPGCHDLRIHNWAESIGCANFLAPACSFVDHIGAVSGMGCPQVKFPSFPGRSWSYRRSQRGK